MDWIIETNSLSRRFDGFLAVDELNLQVRRGCFYGFLGPNGAGKSTTIKMLTGLLAPTAGTVRVLGRDLANQQEALEVKRRTGVVPENLSLFDNLTAREYLTFIGRMYSLPRDTVRRPVQRGPAACLGASPPQCIGASSTAGQARMPRRGP